MRIVKVELLHAQAVEDGWRPIFCRVYTDEGLFGDGEAALSYGGASHATLGIMREMAKLLIGENPLDHEVAWGKLYRGCCWGLNGGPIIFGGISAFDIALWDIKGKAYQTPLYHLLGGKQHNALRAYASQLRNGWGPGRTPARMPEDYARQAKIAMDKGFQAVKFNFLTFQEKEGRYPHAEQAPYISPEYMRVIEARIAAVREQLGDCGEIILENHCYTDVQSAIQVGKMAQNYNIMYYEEPVTPQENLLRTVHQETGLPVASGERIYTRWQFKKHLNCGSIQIIQPDLGTCGGITEAKKICDMAYVYETGVQIHVCASPLLTAASLHPEAAIPNFIIHEYNVNTAMPKMAALTRYQYEPVNGFLSVPELPGIGNEISQQAFAEGEKIIIE